MTLSGKNYKTIVIKVGSSLFYSKKESLDIERLSEIVSQITFLLKKENRKIIIVSSGAIALGMDILGLKSRPKDLPYLQAAAAIGQNVLMDSYGYFLKKSGINSAQILLTWDDFNDRRRYLNAKNTLLTLLKLGSVPIINENDTVSTEEIKFGDNDRLSALVAALISADLLVILSDVDGLLDHEKKVIPVVDEINSQIKSLACPTAKRTCVGGMITKIEAAKICVDSGIPCVIANGQKKEIILSVLHDPQKYGTIFVPKAGLTQRERWIAFGTKPKGKIIVDEGAKKALLDKKSLLSVGITNLENSFDKGDIVSIVDTLRIEFARGKVGLSSRKIEEVKGKRSDKEVIHRNDIVIL